MIRYKFNFYISAFFFFSSLVYVEFSTAKKPESDSPANIYDKATGPAEVVYDSYAKGVSDLYADGYKLQAHSDDAAAAEYRKRTPRVIQRESIGAHEMQNRLVYEEEAKRQQANDKAAGYSHGKVTGEELQQIENYTAVMAGP